jgi:hypothetical protein
MLLDDEVVPYVVGECLVHLPREEVEEKVQQGEQPARCCCPPCCRLKVSSYACMCCLLCLR